MVPARGPPLGTAVCLFRLYEACRVAITHEDVRGDMLRKFEAIRFRKSQEPSQSEGRQVIFCRVSTGNFSLRF